MNVLVILLLGILLAAPAEQPIQSKPDAAAKGSEAVEQEYQKLLEMDEDALRKFEDIIQEARAFEQQGAPIPKNVLIQRIERVIRPVQRAYEEFIDRNPEHVKARIAFASYLQELGDEETAIIHLERARELAPKNPTPWNNLANIYGHIGPIRKAFHYYEEAMELDPTEPVYVHNLAIITYLFRKDAMEMFRIPEDKVFDKALELYRQAMKLDPTNLVLATDYAQSYYGIKPMRVKEARAAWEHALTLAKEDIEKQKIYLHLARIELNNGMFEDAEAHLAMATHPDVQDLKKVLQRNLDKKKKGENDAEGSEPEADSSTPEPTAKLAE